jgi:hypothetical protein
MQNSYRLTIRNASTLRVVEADNAAAQERLSFRTCFMVWTGLAASSWAAIACIMALI